MLGGSLQRLVDHQRRMALRLSLEKLLPLLTPLALGTLYTEWLPMTPRKCQLKYRLRGLLSCPSIRTLETSIFDSSRDPPAALEFGNMVV
ncbi:hypothetical protein CPC08DRAFT_224374 [Agrocybe pediades]|nr:hypothetical protein CPC08DRAFT_224374 [Agrocybe pediades]